MKARVLKTIRSQINSLRNTLLPRQSGAVEGEAYSNTGEPFQRSAGSIVQLTEEGRVIEAPDVKVVEEIAKKVSDQRTAELEAILADGVGAEYCGATLSATLTNTDPSLTLTPTIGEANGFSVDGQSIVASKAGRYGVSFVATLEGNLVYTQEVNPPLELRACVNGTSVKTQTRELSLGIISDLEREKQWSLELVLDLKEDDELTFELEVIDWSGKPSGPFEVNASASLSVWCVSARKASAGGGAGGIPPSVFFPTDEASLLEALAADGVRTIIMSQPTVLTDNTIPIGSGVCNLNTHDGGGVSTLILAPTNSTATTLTGDGAVIYVDGDLSSLGFVLNGVEIYCKRMSVGGDQTVTATTTEKLYYERMVEGSLTGAVEQLYWSNTYTPQPTETTDIWDVFDQDHALTTIPELSEYSRFLAHKINGVVTIESILYSEDDATFKNTYIKFKDAWRPKTDFTRYIVGISAGVTGTTDSTDGTYPIECMITADPWALVINNRMANDGSGDFSILSINFSYVVNEE